MGYLPWILTACLAILIGILGINMAGMRKELVAALEAIEAAQSKLKVMAVAMIETDNLVDQAMPVVMKLELEPQAGEWKFHQAYARLTRAHPNTPKWRIGLAIHQALSQLRVHENVGT